VQSELASEVINSGIHTFPEFQETVHEGNHVDRPSNERADEGSVTLHTVQAHVPAVGSRIILFLVIH